MTRRLLLGIDIGTSGLKAILADPDGTILAQASQEYPTAFPHPDWAEQDPEDWWRAACTAIPRVLAEAGARSDAIAAIGISGQAPGALLVDAEGLPLHPALIWMDRRSEPECAWLREHVGPQAIARTNGGRIDPYYLAPKLLWLKTHAPEAIRAASVVLQPNGFLVRRLTGASCMDLTNGPLTLFFDAARRRYDPDLVTAMGLEPSLLPRLVDSTEIIGAVTSEAAAATGLAAGTPVIAGACDGAAAAVEAGLLEPGDAVEMTGSSTVLLACSTAPYLGDLLTPLVHAVPERYLAIGATVASGASLRWFRDQLGQPEVAEAARTGRNAFDLLAEGAAGVPPGANRLLFLPYMFGERAPIWDTAARGVFFGLTLATRREEMVRAVLEGAAFALRHNAATAADAGFPVRALACVGGGARSDLWNQIKADVLGVPVRVPRAATGAPMGDVMAAGVGVGIYRDFASAVSRVVRVDREFLPGEADRALYDDLYRVYLGLYPALRESFAALAEAGHG